MTTTREIGPMYAASTLAIASRPAVSGAGAAARSGGGATSPMAGLSARARLQELRVTRWIAQVAEVVAKR